MAITGQETTVQEIIDHVEDYDQLREMAHGTNYHIDFYATEFPHKMLSFVEMEFEAYKLLQTEANRGTVWLSRELAGYQSKLQNAQASLSYWTSTPTYGPDNPEAVIMYTEDIAGYTQRIQEISAILSSRGVAV